MTREDLVFITGIRNQEVGMVVEKVHKPVNPVVPDVQNNKHRYPYLRGKMQ